MTFAKCLHVFFSHYLTKIKGVSDNTIKTYRDCFALFLVFIDEHHHLDIKTFQLEQLTTELLIDFLIHLEEGRGNSAKTRNLRLAAFKSLAKMIRIYHPQMVDIAERLQNIPQKRVQKKLVGFLTQQESFKVFKAVDLNKNGGFRDYCLLHLLLDSGSRASEIATLKIDYFDQEAKTLAILGKGDKYRLVELWPKTVDLLVRYIKDYRTAPRLPLYHNVLFVNQRGEELTRHGIYKICKKYLSKALPANRLKVLNPAHSFRHSCAMNMLIEGKSVTDIKNRLGHENIDSTMIYLQLDLGTKREVQQKFIQYNQGVLGNDPYLEELFDWDDKEQILNWLDSL
ncbi:MAG: site-specific integrase [Desulfobulbaceae bacterium]|nr:site-specific integrase [Desulfobulbaceae bacterium]